MFINNGMILSLILIHIIQINVEYKLIISFIMKCNKRITFNGLI